MTDEEAKKSWEDTYEKMFGRKYKDDQKKAWGKHFKDTHRDWKHGDEEGSLKND